MRRRPYANDWEHVGSGLSGDALQHSAHLNLYFYQGRVYDKRSAQHNGLIGMGAQFRDIIAQQ